MMYIVSPAYGRDYPTSNAASEAWHAGKDFIHETQSITLGGTYISCRDLPNDAKVKIRFFKKRRTVIVENKRP